MSETSDAWEDGHRGGYQKGRDDGILIGYADAKLRAYLALDALADTQRHKSAVVEFRNALETSLGPR